MRISKLYSNKSNFKEIIFNDGFNLIMAKIDKTNKNDTHGLGKTTIANLIDFLLLKKTSFLNAEIFKEYIFFLEIQLNSGTYLTIKRGVETSSKVSLCLHDLGKQNFLDLPVEDWDHSEITIAKAKKSVDLYIAFDVLKEYSLRQFLKFIIRTQNDYNFNFKKHEVHNKDWVPQLLNLFGMKKENFVKKLNLLKERDKLGLSYNLHKETDFSRLEELKQLKTTLERDSLKLKSQIESFNYEELDNSITTEAAEENRREISLLNQNKFNITVDISNIKDSLSQTNSIIDMNSIEHLFKEVNIYFEGQLKKDYDDLLAFNHKLFLERQQYLTDMLKEKEADLEKINKKLAPLYKRQQEILTVISRQDDVRKILDHQKEYNKYLLNIAKIDNEIKLLEESKVELKKYKELEIELNKANLEILNDLEFDSEIRSDIVKHLSEISEEIFFDLTTLLTITPNTNGNPDFSLTLKNIRKGTVTSEDEGANKGRLMRCSFDLALITAYSKHNFIRFLFHDGAIEATDNKLKKKYIETVKKYVSNYNIQYITTAIEDEIKEISDLIEDTDIVLRLTDDEDYSGTLFGFKF